MDTSTGHIPLRFITVGDAAQPRIVFLHGFLGSGSDWLAVARRLEQGYCSILVDLPGHGGADMSGTAGREGFFSGTVDALAEGLRRIGPAPSALVGYSMGGRIALALALRHPALFDTAVIVSSSPGLRSEEERRLRREHDDRLAADLERDPEGFLERWYKLPLFETLAAHPVFPEILAARRTGSPESLAASLRLLGTGNQPQLWDELPGNRLPILFCAGEKDGKFVEIGRQMVNLCPRSSLELFDGCGHTLHLEEPDLFLERLTRFINNHRNS